MAPLKKQAWGWLCLFQIFPANYGFHLSSPQGTFSPETDYAGVSEAAGLQSLRSVTGAASTDTVFLVKKYLSSLLHKWKGFIQHATHNHSVYYR